jgi:lysophospholipase L1-like esterase|tara:strand:- start:540 stop:1622 length:1083 start_codon:yes stop_codon:yes gene_type:complete
LSVQISYKKQILIYILLLLVLLSAIEIILRAYDYYEPNCRFIESDVYAEISFDLKREICVGNDKLVWNNNPLYLIPNQHFKTINVNSDGFRGDELQNNPDYRIFLIGGSTMFGAGSTSDSTTIPSYLQKKISAKLPEHNIEIINAGIPKAYSFTESNLIKNKLLEYNPDLLIIYDGWNDLTIDYDHYSDAVDYKLMDQIIRLIRQSDYVTPTVLLKWYFNYQHDNISVIQFNPSNIEQKISLWSDAWVDICNLQSEYDFKTVIMIQPIVGTGNKSLSPEEQQYFSHYDNESKIRYYQLYADALPKLNSTCTATYDLRNVFDSFSETIFYDPGHVGDFGNNIIAEKIYEKIIPIVIKDVSN